MAGVFLGSIYATLEMKTAKFNSALSGVESKFGKAGTASMGFAKVVGAASVAAGAAMVYAGKQAADFETQMADVSTLIAGDSTQAMGTLRQGILDMVKEIPKSPEELGASAYAITSAGITDAAEALKVLESSAKLAVAGLGTTEEATNLMTSAINSFASEGLTAAEISDILFKTVKNGKTTVAELSQGFGAVAGQMSDAGIPMKDFMSVISALTTVGVPASQAYTQMRAVIAGLTRETETSKKVFGELGVKTFKELIAKTGGVGKAMQAVKEQVGDNDAEMLKLVGSTEAMAAITSISGATSEAYANTLNDMEDATYGVNEAFEKQKATANNQLKLLGNQLQVVAVELGSKLLPYVTQFADFMLNRVVPAASKLFTWLGQNKIVIAALAGAIIGGLVPAFIIMAVNAWLAVAPLLPFIALGAAIAALAYLIISNWDTLKGWFITFKDVIVNGWNTIYDKIVVVKDIVVGAFSDAINSIKATWQTVYDAVTGFLEDNETAIKNVGVVIGAALLPKITQIGIQFAITAGRAVASAAITAGAWVASAAQSLLAFVIRIPGLIAQFVLASGSAIINAAITTGAWIASAATTLFQWGITFAGYLAGMAVAVAQSALAALRIAASWLLAMGPIGLIVAVVIAAVALIILNWDKVKTFAIAVWNWIKNAAVTVFNFIKGAVVMYINAYINTFMWLRDRVVGAWNWIKDKAVAVFNGIKTTISNVVDTVVGWFSGLGGRIGSAIGGIADTVSSPFRAAFNAVAGFWNSTVGKISFTAPDWVPGIGGKGFSMPTIPTLAQGGIATRATLAMIGEGGEPEAVIPLSKLSQIMRNELPSMRTSVGSVPNGLDTKTSGSNGDVINIDRLELPNVQNPDDFVRDMKLKLASMRGV